MLRPLSPETDAFLRQHSVPYAAALSAGGSARHALSLYPGTTARSLIFLAAFSLLLAGLTASLRAGGIRRLSERLTILAVLMALIGIVQKATVTTGKLYGFWAPSPGFGRLRRASATLDEARSAKSGAPGRSSKREVWTPEQGGNRMHSGRAEIRAGGLFMVDIPKLVEHWRRGALEDWEVATDLVKRGRCRHGLFFAHLALEKALKSHVSLRTQDVPPTIHNLVRLCELAGLEPPVEHVGILADMNTFSLAGRYPDSLPAPVGQDEAQRLLTQAHEVLQWLIAP